MSADPGASVSSGAGVAMVTGAGSGIGRAVALRLAKEKWDLAIIDMNDDGLQETQKLIEEVSGTGRSRTYVVDVTDAGGFEAVVADIVTNAGEIRVLVSNAGVLSVTPVLELSIEQWRRTVDVNLTGSFICTRAVAREMVRAGTPGRIVTVASVHSVAPGTNVTDYDASKGGLLMLTRSLARAARAVWHHGQCGRTRLHSHESGRGRLGGIRRLHRAENSLGTCREAERRRRRGLVSGRP